MPVPHDHRRDADPNFDPAATTGGDPTQTFAPPTLTAAWRYLLGEEIGHGGMGVVYRATDAAFGRDVAVKVLHERFGPDSGAARRFADEARITGQLQHPGIPPVHDLGALPDGRPFLAMKLIRGRTLELLLAERPDLGHERGRFVAAFEQVCQAVAYAHIHGVIHRDLKPANVMVGGFGEVQVMDWGLAKVLAAAGGTPGEGDPEQTSAATQIQSLRDSDGSFTQAGSVLGSPAFMPPEQALGAVGKADARSDVFGLGAILAVILTGKPPFDSGSAEAVRIQSAQGILDGCFARLDGCGAEPELVAVCRRCLSPKPADRPADAGEVARAIAAFRAAADERARAELDRVKAESKAAEQWRRWRLRGALFAVVAALVLGAGAVALSQRERRGRTAEAVSGLLDQCEAALRAGEAAEAALALEAARKRSAEGGAGGQAERLGWRDADLAVLRELDEIDRFRWTLVENRYPPPAEVAARYREMLRRFGADPDGDSADVAVARASGTSGVRDRLVVAFDRVLRAEKTAGIRAALRAMDTDPFRDAVRDAVLAGDGAKVAQLAAGRVALEQPPEFAAFLGDDGAIDVGRRRRLLEAAVSRRPGDLGLLMSLAATYPFDQQEWTNERLRWCQAAVAAAPANPAAHNNLGLVLRQRKDLAGAEAAYREAIRLAPRMASAHIGLGNVLWDAKDSDGAEAAYREAIRLDPKLAIAHNNLGLVLRLRKDLAGAEAACREAIRLDAKFTDAHTNLGSVLWQKIDLAGAAAAYREAVRLAPKVASRHSDLGFALWHQQELAGAAAAYREAIRLDPMSAEAHNGLGNVLKQRKDLAGAQAAFEESLRLDPKSVPTHNNLGLVRRARRDLDGAKAAFEEAIRLDPNFVSAHSNLGLTLSMKGDQHGAEAAYRNAVRITPQDVEAHLDLGNLLWQKNDLAGAAAACRQAVRFDPKLARAHGSLGWVLQQNGELEEAVTSYEHALRLDANNFFAMYRLPQVKRMRELLTRLPDVLAGKDEPKTPAEVCEFARLCSQPFQKRYAAAVGLYEKAFAADPKLATYHLHDGAANCALRAAGGEGIDSPTSGPDRATLRKKALDWLRASLPLWQRKAASASADDRSQAASALAGLLTDPTLSGGRDPRPLGELPDAEREQWQKFWADVKATLAKARIPPPPPERLPPPDVEQ